MKNKKAVKLLATINILAMLTMLGQPVVKAQQPKDIYPVEINETYFPDELIRKDIINIVDDNKDGKIEKSEADKVHYYSINFYEGLGKLEKYNTGLGEFVDEPATINLKGLEVLENLEELSVGIEHKIKLENLSTVEKFKKLKKLILLNGTNTALDKINLENNKNLNTLVICGKLKNKNLNFIKKNKELKNVNFTYLRGIKTLDFSKNKKLKNVVIAEGDFKKINFGKNNNLTKLQIDMSNKFTGLNIKGLKKLKKLRITQCNKIKRIYSGKKQKVKSVKVKDCKRISKKDVKRIKK